VAEEEVVWVEQLVVVVVVDGEGVGDHAAQADALAGPAISAREVDDSVHQLVVFRVGGGPWPWEITMA
jgi:hypothetical protein